MLVLLLVVYSKSAEAYNYSDTLPGTPAMVPGLYEGHYIPVRSDTPPPRDYILSDGQGPWFAYTIGLYPARAESDRP